MATLDTTLDTLEQSGKPHPSWPMTQPHSASSLSPTRCCRGVWLDRGELDKIIERTGQASAPSQQASPGYPRHGGDDEHALGRSRHGRSRGGF